MSERQPGWYADGLGRYEWYDGTAWTGELVTTPPSVRVWRSELRRRERAGTDRVIDLANDVPASDEVAAMEDGSPAHRRLPRLHIGARRRHG